MTAFADVTRERSPWSPEAAFYAPVGAASPLWVVFAGAALSGMTWWWMTRWSQPQNLEAMFGAAAERTRDVADRVTETTAAVAPIAERLIEQAVPPKPLGGEAAPLGGLALDPAAARPPAASEPKPAAKLTAVETPAPSDVKPEPEAKTQPEAKAQPAPAPEPRSVAPKAAKPDGGGAPKSI